ncbi:MAG: tripartite tricarboxylate transporter substrate binding protein [Betaproteobacteria bacterium]|nr:tripartite tricarboxylate transporter substrate binding protein [Betaproteobacteria bacterium]
MKIESRGGRIVSGAALLCLLELTPGPAAAQAWPSRPITWVVPYGAGSGNDILARNVGLRLAQRLGQPIVIDNKVGASGNIGADYVAKSAPNGYTLLFTSNPLAVTPALFKNVPFHPVNDFTHIAKIGTGNMALVVNPVVFPVKTLDELVAAARARPGKLNYSSSGPGTPHHLTMELLKKQLGLDVVHIPYKGAPAALNDLVAGQVQLAMVPVHTALPHARAGKLVVIAVSGKGRSVLAPESPSFDELGLKDLDMDLYYAVSGPANMPRDIVMKLNQEIAAVMALAETRESMLQQGMIPDTTTPDELTAMIRSDAERWKKFIAETKITAD